MPSNITMARMLAENPLRTNFQQRYEEIVAAYNSEKDRVTIETTFEALLRLVGDLDDESARAMREGLDEETLTLFDLNKGKEIMGTKSAPGKINDNVKAAGDFWKAQGKIHSPVTPADGSSRCGPTSGPRFSPASTSTLSPRRAGRLRSPRR